MTVQQVAFDEVAEVLGAAIERDVTGLGGEELLAEQATVARVQRLASTLLARYAAEVDRRSRDAVPGHDLARARGFRNPVDLIASVTGTTGAGARNLINAGRAFAPDPSEPGSVPDGFAPLGSVPDGSVPDGSVPDGFAVPGDEAASPDGADSRDLLAGFPALLPARPVFAHVAAAAAAGDLSTDIASMMTRALEELKSSPTGPDAEGIDALEARLVKACAGKDATTARKIITRAVARADVADLVQREKHHLERRFVSIHQDVSGVVTLNARLDPVAGAAVKTVIEQIVTHDFRVRRDGDRTDTDQRSVGQMRADALTWLCRHAIDCDHTASRGVRTTIVVRVAEEDLLSGDGVGTIDGIDQPLSISTVRAMAADAEIMGLKVDCTGAIIDLGTTSRFFSRLQRIALLERDGGCAKCHAPPEHCEAHHIHWWSHGGKTDLSNGVMLCTRCHHDVHRQGWDIRIRGRNVEFIPPAFIDPTRQPQPGGRAALDITPPGARRATSQTDADRAHRSSAHDDPGYQHDCSHHHLNDLDNDTRRRLDDQLLERILNEAAILWPEEAVA